jgi:CRISPR-associated protein Cmr6
MTDINDIPLMFQAQIQGRCQLQYAQSQDAQKWTSEWTEYGATGEYDFGSEVQTKTYQISWRFVTNGGQDDGIIRPVIGADGLPFYPGSSMKGAFRKACELEEKAGKLPSGTCARYCGNKEDLEPGILRFHGGYPTNDWKQQLLDIVHPQQGWQVKEIDTTKKSKGETAYSLISLYQPQLEFGISSAKLDINWDEVWQIWEKALGYGIGCRVSSGYGLTQGVLDKSGKTLGQVEIQGTILYQVRLQGQGTASQSLNSRQSEFRPNMFRATLRSHALRLFAGLNPLLAEDIVDDLFGGIRSQQEKVGLLRVVFLPDSSEVLENAYKVTGNLIWILFQEYPSTMADGDKEKLNKCLKNLTNKLAQFAMLLGGFGKSWRRADHQIFYPKYKGNSIGCHWQWVNQEDNFIQNLKDEKELIQKPAKLIQETVSVAQQWIELRFPTSQNSLTNSQEFFQLTPQENRMEKLGVILKSVQEKRNRQQAKNQNWREAWHESNVQVWGRIAKNKEDSKVIPWLHDSQRVISQKQREINNKSSASHANVNPAAIARTNKAARPTIYRTCLTGRVRDTKKSNDPTAIGRFWHRMYPLSDERYLELIVIFPIGCEVAESFVTWLNSSQSTFVKLQWSNQGAD